MRHDILVSGYVGLDVGLLALEVVNGLLVLFAGNEFLFGSVFRLFHAVLAGFHVSLDLLFVLFEHFF